MHGGPVLDGSAGLCRPPDNPWTPFTHHTPENAARFRPVPAVDDPIFAPHPSPLPDQGGVNRQTATDHPVARDPAQADALHRLDALARALEQQPHPRQSDGWWSRLRGRFGAPPEPLPGIYLWGGVGRGKTHCMDHFFTRLTLAEKRRIHFHQFMADIHAALHRLPPQPDPLKVIVDDLARETRVLCLDEFVVTDIGDAMLLHGLLQALFERAVTLVTTSNTAPEALYLKGLQRQRFLPAIELLQRHTEILHLDAGVDYRLLPEAETAALLTEIGPVADAWLERRFEQLAGEAVPGAASLRINRRDIPLRRLGPGVVWFDFDTLCNSPRSSADYLQLTRDFHTVLLSEVPILVPALDEAARRFLHLVDVFYDRKLRLILTTAAPLDELYQGNLPAAAYRRLHSRLVEMLAWK